MISPLLKPTGKRKPRIFSLVCLSIFAAFSPALAADKAGPTLDAYLKQLRYEPIELKRDDLEQLFVRGEFGGGKKRLFLVDTGCGMTILDPKGARGLKTLGELKVALDDKALGRLTNADVVIMDKLILGRAQFLNQPARVHKLETDYVQNSFDGILGCDFFVRNFCLLDCRAGRLYVRATEPSEPESKALEETLRRSGFAEAPLQLEAYLEVEAEANGDKPLHLLIDTGAVVSILDESQLTWLSLSTIKLDELYPGALSHEDSGVRVIGIGKIGAHKLRVTTLKKLRIGSREWSPIHFGAANLNPWMLAPRTNDWQGILGRDMLTGNGALIDFSGGKLWFSPEKAGAKR